MYWIQLVQWQTIGDTTVDLRVPYKEESFLKIWATVSFWSQLL